MPDVLAVVDRQRVVGCVHADHLLVVVIGKGRVDAERLLQCLAGTAATGEQVDHDFVWAQARELGNWEVEGVRAVSHRVPPAVPGRATAAALADA